MLAQMLPIGRTSQYLLSTEHERKLEHFNAEYLSICVYFHVTVDRGLYIFLIISDYQVVMSCVAEDE